LKHFVVILNNSRGSFGKSDEELNWLLSNSVVGEVVLSDDLDELREDLLEASSEEFGFDFSDFIELNKSVLEFSLFFKLKSFKRDGNHSRNKVLERLSIFVLSELKVVRNSLESSEVDLEILMSESLLEDSKKVVLELEKMIEDNIHQPIEGVETTFDLQNIISVNELEDKVEEVTPDGIVLFFIHDTCNFSTEV
jgi:hypothetical protein